MQGNLFCLLPLGDSSRVSKALNQIALVAKHRFAPCFCTILVQEKYTRSVTLQSKEAASQSLL